MNSKSKNINQMLFRFLFYFARVLHRSFRQQMLWVFVWPYQKKYRDIQSRRISIESSTDFTVSRKHEWW